MEDLNKEIEKVATDALSEYILNRVTLIGDGSGNLLRIGNRKFIITCLHVANIFHGKGFKEIILRGNIKIPSDKIKLVASTENLDKGKEEKDQLDIAVFEFNEELRFEENENLFYTIDDFEIIENFKDYNWELTDLILSGYPEAIILKFGKDKYYSPFTLTTVPIQDRNNETFVFGKYPKGNVHKYNKTELPIELFAPYGISGAFILKDKTFTGPHSELWFPHKAKIVAIQGSYSEKGKFIKGTNIKYLFELLDKIGLFISKDSL